MAVTTLSKFRAGLISLYRETRPAELFLSGFFDVRPGNIRNTEVIAFDIKREDEQISPVVNTCEGPTFNEMTQFTSKEVTPPTLNEAMPFDCKELLFRQAGETQFEASDVGFQRTMVDLLMEGMDNLDQKMRRNRELQASQIFQGGVLSLRDEDGNPAYTIDYQQKATHQADPVAAWTGASDKLADLENMADIIRDDSLQDADQIFMGATALSLFLQDSEVQNQLDNRRFEIGRVTPEPRGMGSKFIGVVNVGSYRFDLFVFNGRGIEPGQAKAKFLNDSNIIMRASSGRLDTVFAGVPVSVKRDPRFDGLLPDRISVPMATDISPNIYATENGRQTILELMSRPLLIPTAIDSFSFSDITA